MSVSDTLDRAFVPVQAAVESGRIPGAILGVVDADGTRATRIIGQAQKVPVSRPMTEDTWFDLASLTKVIFTTPRILALAEAGTIDLDTPLISVIPDFRQYNPDNWERKITFRQCLGHQTPFPAVFPLYTYGRDPDLLRTFLLQHEFPAGPAVYSDINFILLGFALERIHGGTDPAAFADRVLQAAQGLAVAFVVARKRHRRLVRERRGQRVPDRVRQAQWGFRARFQRPAQRGRVAGRILRQQHREFAVEDPVARAIAVARLRFPPAQQPQQAAAGTAMQAMSPGSQQQQQQQAQQQALMAQQQRQVQQYAQQQAAAAAQQQLMVRHAARFQAAACVVQPPAVLPAAVACLADC